MLKSNNNVKYSYGIVCCHKGANGNYEVAMVRKRYTYAYVDFVTANYPQASAPSQAQYLINLFSAMTVDEKIIILSLKFDQIWYHLWLNHAPPRQFFAAKSRFEGEFLADGGERLRALIERSKNARAELLWELPKGHKLAEGEDDISCAIREFAEETGISKRQYRILSATKSLTYSDGDYTYTTKYFFAHTSRGIIPSVSFETKTARGANNINTTIDWGKPRADCGKSRQISEVNDCRWMSMEELRLVDDHNCYAAIARACINYCKKHI